MLKRLRGVECLNRPLTAAVRPLHPPEAVTRHLPRVGPVSAKLPNGRTLRLWSRGDDLISSIVYWKGWDAWEPESTPTWFALAEKARVTVDVGAFVGYHTLLAAHANPEARVIAVEPNAVPHERLRRHVEMNALTNVTCLNVAASDRDGEATFYTLTRSALPMAPSLRPDALRDEPDLIETTVRVVRLDRVLAGLAVDLVKLDVEGVEAEVLTGMRETLGRCHPAILCEALPRNDAQRIEAILWPLGYRATHLTPGGPIRRDHIEPHLHWRNYLLH